MPAIAPPAILLALPLLLVAASASRTVRANIFNRRMALRLRVVKDVELVMMVSGESGTWGKQDAL